MDSVQLTMMRFEYKKAIVQSVMDPGVDLTKLTETPELLQGTMQAISVFASQCLADDIGFFQAQLQSQSNTDENEGVEGQDSTDGND